MRRKSAKQDEKVPRKKNLSNPWCSVCGAPRPGGPDNPLPHGWNNHCIDDASYERGYWLPLTCSDECRAKGLPK